MTPKKTTDEAPAPATAAPQDGAREATPDAVVTDITAPDSDPQLNAESAPAAEPTNDELAEADADDDADPTTTPTTTTTDSEPEPAEPTPTLKPGDPLTYRDANGSDHDASLVAYDHDTGTAAFRVDTGTGTALLNARIGDAPGEVRPA